MPGVVPPRKDAEMDGVLLSYREIDISRPAYASKSAPDPFADVRKKRQHLRDRRAFAKQDEARSAPLPQKEFATDQDWQLKQALNALAGKPVQVAPANLNFLAAQSACMKIDG